MRIISGEARGRRLYAPVGDATRPTSDKLRGSLFNILFNRVNDAVVLDLFGGTGALALEALSRGAAYAVICDNAKPAIESIRRNSEAVLHGLPNNRIRIIQSDYRNAISTVAGVKFDIVFLDPPYRMENTYADAINRLYAQDSLTEDAIIIAERRSDIVLSLPENTEIYDTREYGETSVDFIRRRTV